jgi:hypothetical protein
MKVVASLLLLLFCTAKASVAHGLTKGPHPGPSTPDAPAVPPFEATWTIWSALALPPRQQQQMTKRRRLLIGADLFIVQALKNAVRRKWCEGRIVK